MAGSHYRQRFFQTTNYVEQVVVLDPDWIWYCIMCWDIEEARMGGDPAMM